MIAKLHVCTIDGGLAVRIPEDVAEQMGLCDGAAIEIETTDDGSTLRRDLPNIAELVNKITPENNHPEVDWGPARGAEAW
ncbi:MAG: AbrB/MazE/SpoVT family DNA-binding domain-containing protein [Chloroflexi bacterium]|nr:AbrB/MazE/SpoVT family DNA-binding domain-containing protein [Chloroflexota bacterium]